MVVFFFSWFVKTNTTSDMPGNTLKGGDSADIQRALRALEREDRLKYDPYNEEDDRETHVLRSKTCPTVYGTDTNNKPARGWYPVTRAEGDRMDRKRANIKRYNQVTVTNDKGERVHKKLETSDGKRCVRYRPEGEKQRLEWNDVIGEVRKLVRHIKHDVRKPMENQSREQELIWKRETRKQLDAIRDTDLTFKYGQDAYFEPDTDEDLACDPQQKGSTHWTEKYGTPNNPTNPNIRPTSEELRQDKWLRPSIVSVGGQPRCVPSSWINKRTNNTLQQSYPVSYHDYSELQELNLPHDRYGPEDPMKFYQKAALCAQSLDKKSCTSDDLAIAPFGGKLKPSETCTFRGKPGNQKCVPKSLSNSTTGHTFKKDDPLNDWYKKFMKSEHANMRKDPYLKMAMYGMNTGDKTSDGLAIGARMNPRGLFPVPDQGLSSAPDPTDEDDQEYYGDYSEGSSLSTGF